MPTCETCKWFELSHSIWGKCKFPVPKWLETSGGGTWMEKQQADDCRTHAPKGGDDA